MRAPTYTDSRQGLAQACDLLRYTEGAKKRKIALPPPGQLLVLTGLIAFVLLLVFGPKNQPKPVTPESGITRILEKPLDTHVPEVRRATYVIGAQYNLGTEQVPFNVVFRGTEKNIDALMRVPHPQEGDMYWVADTGHCWFLTRVGSAHRLSWVDP